MVYCVWGFGECKLQSHEKERSRRFFSQSFSRSHSPPSVQVCTSFLDGLDCSTGLLPRPWPSTYLATCRTRGRTARTAMQVCPQAGRLLGGTRRTGMVMGSMNLLRQKCGFRGYDNTLRSFPLSAVARSTAIWKLKKHDPTFSIRAERSGEYSRYASVFRPFGPTYYTAHALLLGIRLYCG